MKKTKLGAQLVVPPCPNFLVGADIDGKPNFMAVAWGGVANSKPPMLSVAIQHSRYTYRGIKTNSTFSVNIPTISQVTEYDYCGIVSGSKVDKNSVCRFKVFYGETPHAPLIEQCPVNLECKVIHILNLGSHALIVGEIVQAHVDSECLTDGHPDPSKIKPFIFCESKPSSYTALGEVTATAFKVGKTLKN